MKVAARFAALLLALLLLAGCAASPSPSPIPSPSVESPSPTPTPEPILDPAGQTVGTRFRPPPGFLRSNQAVGSFGAFLRELPLKPDGDAPLLFDGTKAEGASSAVVSLPVTELMQNTDALLKLRAEYLFQQGRQAEIQFHFLSGFAFSFDKWAEGYQVAVDGKNVRWVKVGEPDASAARLNKYLNTLYAYSNATAALADVESAQTPEIGCVFLEDGGAIIVDMATNAESGERAVILAKGGNPAQEITLLTNAKEPSLSPWLVVSDGGVIYTQSNSYVIDAMQRFTE